MKQLILSEEIQKEKLNDFMNMRELEESNRIMNERNQVLSALSRYYTTVLLCDLKQDTFEIIKADAFTYNDHEEKQELVRGSNWERSFFLY